MTDRLEIIRAEAQAAETLLTDETYQSVMRHLRAVAMTEWSMSAPGSGSLREALWWRVNALEAIETELKTRVERFEFEVKKLESAERRNQGAKR